MPRYLQEWTCVISVLSKNNFISSIFLPEKTMKQVFVFVVYVVPLAAHLDHSESCVTLSCLCWQRWRLNYRELARKGCYFHFCQSLWRRIQTLGLARGYRRHRQVRTFLRKFMSMGYLPLAVVRQNFRLLYNSNTVRRLVRRVPLLRQFISYFRRNYMDGYFRPALWNVFDRNVNTRTNNHIEGKVFQLWP